MERFDLSAGSSPRERPMTYPGIWPDRSVLLSAHGVWPITDREDAPLGSAAEPFRLGHTRVRVPADLRTALRLGDAMSPMLVDVLERLNVVGADARIPVVAVGSNASPAQMAHKFHNADVTDVVPMIAATVVGGAAGFAPVVAPAGYVPATLVAAPTRSTRLFVQLLDAAQLAVLDSTEHGYKRVLAAEAGIRVRLDSGEELTSAYAYVYDSGWLIDEGGAPLRMRSRFDGGDDTVPDQPSLLAELVERSPAVRALRPDAATWLEDMDASLRSDLAAAFRADGLVGGDGFGRGLRDTEGEPAIRYGAGALSVKPGTIIARASGDDIRRRGESVVRLTRAGWMALGSPRHVQVASEYVVQTRQALAPTALGAVVIGENGTEGEAEIDHVLRMGVGLEVGERVRMRAVRLRSTPLADLVFGVPNSLSMRVTLADPSTAERRAVLMSELSLALLGVESGDKVLLEGSAGDDGAVPVEAVKAFAVPDTLAADRAASTNGSWGTRFPSPRDVLGVNPDLPVVFVDAATRARLGVHGQQLATVRVRPARGHQFVREVREIALVLAVALLGVVGLVDDPLAVWALVAVLAVSSIGLVVARMRGRLTLGAGRRRG